MTTLFERLRLLEWAPALPSTQYLAGDLQLVESISDEMPKPLRAIGLSEVDLASQYHRPVAFDRDLIDIPYSLVKHFDGTTDFDQLVFAVIAQLLIDTCQRCALVYDGRRSVSYSRELGRTTDF